MALGGGTFLTQNKILPGAYLNFISASRASANLSDRGVATFPLAMSWGPEGTVTAVTAADLQKNSQKLFGYGYTHEALRPLRELFATGLRTLYLYRLNKGGVQAANDYASARQPGKRGNDLKTVIQKGEGFVEETNPVYDVSTYLGSALVDTQKGVKSASELKENDFVSFKTEAVLAETAGAPLTGGTDGAVEDGAYQEYLDQIESYAFNCMGCDSPDDAVKALFAAFTKRMRDEVGVKFQTVLHRYEKADYEGVISVENGLEGDGESTAPVYWATGAEAACAVNASLTNTVYNGEYSIQAGYTQAQLEAGLLGGKLMFHRVDDQVRVLSDINTFTSATDGKSADFSENQVVRVLDQIGNDIGALFNSKYLGKVPNDNAGRVSLWADIVKHHRELEKLRAIQAFEAGNVIVEQGESRKAVVVTDCVTPTAAMAQLYMTVIVQ